MKIYYFLNRIRLRTQIKIRSLKIRIRRFFKYPFKSKEKIEKISNQKMALFLEAERKAREKNDIYGKPGRCEFICPNCGSIVTSNYYELDPKKFGDIADYLHGGCGCEKCEIGIRV